MIILMSEVTRLESGSGVRNWAFFPRDMLTSWRGDLVGHFSLSEMKRGVRVDYSRVAVCDGWFAPLYLAVEQGTGSNFLSDTEN